MLALDEISWTQIDPCQADLTSAKFSEKFPCKVTICSCPENGAIHDFISR